MAVEESCVQLDVMTPDPLLSVGVVLLFLAVIYLCWTVQELLVRVEQLEALANTAAPMVTQLGEQHDAGELRRAKRIRDALENDAAAGYIQDV